METTQVWGLKRAAHPDPPAHKVRAEGAELRARLPPPGLVGHEVIAVQALDQVADISGDQEVRVHVDTSGKA